MEGIIMNKRQIKKNQKVKEDKTRALINVDLTNVSDGAEIEIYVSNRFKATRDSEKYFSIGGSREKISVSKVLAKGKDCAIYLVNGKEKRFTVNNVYLSNTEKYYYVIKPVEKPEYIEALENHFNNSK